MRLVKAGLFLILIWGNSGAAALYSGQLSSIDGGLEGNGWWVNSNGQKGWEPATIAWNVSLNPDQTWRYEYTLSVFRADISHWILEVSPTFTLADIQNLNVTQGGYGALELNTFAPQQGNPLMPDSVRGIKFDDAFGEVVQFSFDSPRSPVWGDIYVKGGMAGGSQNALWNSGFAAPDPIIPVHSGSANGHIIVPNSHVVIPEPTTLAAIAGGGLVLLMRRRRHQL